MIIVAAAILGGVFGAVLGVAIVYYGFSKSIGDGFVEYYLALYYGGGYGGVCGVIGGFIFGYVLSN